MKHLIIHTGEQILTSLFSYVRQHMIMSSCGSALFIQIAWKRDLILKCIHIGAKTFFFREICVVAMNIMMVLEDFDE